MRQQERFEDREEAFRLMLDGFQANIWTALPAVVLKFDSEKQTCELQVAIQFNKYDVTGKAIPIDCPPLVDVPVYRLRGGGFSATVPLVAGDEGLVVFSCRCIDQWWQSGCGDGTPQPQPQFEIRMHDLSDGFFLPGFNSQPKNLADFATDAFEIRNDDGTVKVAVKIDEIDVQVTTDVTAKFTSSTIDLKVKSDSTFHMEDGKIALDATEIKFNGIVWDTHEHTDVTSGLDKTGGPVAP